MNKYHVFHLNHDAIYKVDIPLRTESLLWLKKEKKYNTHSDKLIRYNKIC